MAEEFNTMMSSKELQELNQERQTGEVAQEEEPIKAVPSPAPTDYGYSQNENALIDHLRFNRARNRGETYSTQAIEAGYGLSRYDERNPFDPSKDLEDVRAREQSNFAKIGSGIMKGGVTAAATALNTTIGTVFGLGSSLFELAADNNGNGRSFMDTVDAGVNNDLSEALVALQKWSEKIFPNYRTTEERTEQYQREWWKHMGTANFIGDSLIKNFGFTLGAIAGGVGWSALISKGLRAAAAGSMLRGSLAAAAGDAEANSILTAAAEAIKSGATGGAAIEQAINSGFLSARSLSMMGPKLQLIGGAIGAMGEGTVEGIMAKDEYLEDFKSVANQDFALRYQQIEDDVLDDASNPQWRERVPMLDNQGRPVEMYEFTEEGKQEVIRRRRELANEYRLREEEANRLGDRLASTTYLLNLPILTASNTIQFGRLFSGGWKTARNAAVKATGRKKIMEEAVPKVKVNYKPMGRLPRTVLNSLKVAGSESFEEMAQGTISAGAKKVAEKQLASFTNAGYDPDATMSFAEWFAGMQEGGEEYLSDVKNWQEGAIGAFTGLFGIPGKFWKGQWHGGVIGEAIEAKNQYDFEKKYADKLNELVNSDEFQTRWRNYIRHLKYDNDMADAIDRDDEFDWHNADAAQLINDVMTFADAGRINDLTGIIDYFGSMTEANADELKAVIKDSDSYVPASPELDIRNMSAEEVVSRVKEQAVRLKSAINQYKDIYSEVSSYADKDSAKDYLKEVVFTAMQIKDYDNRIVGMLEEVTSEASRYANLKENENYTDVTGDYRNLSDGTMPVGVPAAMKTALAKQIDILDSATKQASPNTNKKVSDMKRLVDIRDEAYKKLRTLSSKSGQEKMEIQAITQQKVDDAAAEAKAKIDTEGVEDLNSAKLGYFRLEREEDRNDYVDSLRKVSDTNKAAKQFLDIKDTLDGFLQFAAERGIYLGEQFDIDFRKDSILRNATSINDVLLLPDKVFADNTGIAAIVNQKFRDAMQEYRRVTNRNSARKAIPDNYKPAEPVNPTPAEAAGPDPNQPIDIVPENGQEVKKPKEPETEPDVLTPLPPNPIVEAMDLANGQEETMTPEKRSLAEANAGDEKIYYDLPVPEIASSEAKQVREGILDKDVVKMQSADLSDFVVFKKDDKGNFVPVKNEAFAETWSALDNGGAFDRIAEDVEEGDEVCFVILPNFPLYNDKPQILVAKVVRQEDGRIKARVLNTLVSNREKTKYKNIEQLRNQIYSEYEKQADKSKPFVFGGFQSPKTSKIWRKQPGYIDYDYTGAEEKPIKDVEGYKESANIIFINQKKDIVTVMGDDKEAGQKVPSSFKNAVENGEGKASRKGNLYYLAKGQTGRYIPIRLLLAHFRKEDMEGDTNPVFKNIRELVSRIATIMSSPDTLGILSANLAADVKRLRRLIYIDNLAITPGQFGSYDEAISYLIGDGRQLQIELDKDDKIRNLKSYIDNGLITTNARMLRQKGANVYFNPWSVEKQAFVAPWEEGAVKTQKQQEATPQVTEVSQEPVVEGGASPRTEQSVSGIKKPRGKAKTSEQKNVDTSESKPLVFNELPDAQKKVIADRGISEEIFNSMLREQQDKIIGCA